MSAALREKEMTQALKEVSERAAEHILTLPGGSVSTIARAVSECYSAEGYCWAVPGTEAVLSRDGGQTFLIKEDELYAVTDEVGRLTEGKVRLCADKHAGMLTGLPWNMEFTVSGPERGSGSYI